MNVLFWQSEMISEHFSDTIKSLQLATSDHMIMSSQQQLHGSKVTILLVW